MSISRQCFVCGKPSRAKQEAPVCAACQIIQMWRMPAERRYRCRGGGAPQQPYARRELIRLIGQGRISHDVTIIDSYGDWLPLTIHPDFRACFLPGTEEFIQIQNLSKNQQEYTKGNSRARWTKFILAFGFLMAGLGFAYFFTESTALVVDYDPYVEQVDSIPEPPPSLLNIWRDLSVPLPENWEETAKRNLDQALPQAAAKSKELYGAALLKNRFQRRWILQFFRSHLLSNHAVGTEFFTWLDWASKVGLKDQSLRGLEAWAWIKRGNWQRAKDAIQDCSDNFCLSAALIISKSVVIPKKDEPNVFWRAYVERSLLTQNAIDYGTLSQRLAKHWPDASISALIAADHALAHQNTKSVIENLQKAISLGERSATAYRFLGLALLHDKQAKRAMQMFKSMPKNVHTADTLRIWSSAAIHENQLNEAVSLAKKSLALSESIEARLLLADAYLRQGDQRQARQNLGKVQPERFVLRMYTARLSIQLSDIRNANGYLEELKPSDTERHFMNLLSSLQVKNKDQLVDSLSGLSKSNSAILQRPLLQLAWIPPMDLKNLQKQALALLASDSQQALYADLLGWAFARENYSNVLQKHRLVTYSICSAQAQAALSDREWAVLDENLKCMSKFKSKDDFYRSMLTVKEALMGAEIGTSNLDNMALKTKNRSALAWLAEGYQKLSNPQQAYQIWHQIFEHPSRNKFTTEKWHSIKTDGEK